MIDLRGLAALAAEHADDLGRPVAPFTCRGRSFDTDARPVVMGVVNLSRDSTYRESVATGTESAVRRGLVLAAQGADLVDLGAEGSDTSNERVDAADQERALVPVIEQLADAGVVVSVESYAVRTVRAALEAGAGVVNLTGSEHDEEMFDLAAEHGAGLVLCHVQGAHARDLDRDDVDADPFPAMLDGFARRLETARAHGVKGVAIDPGLGFGFRLDDPLGRVRHQAGVLLTSFRLRSLGVPVCHALPTGFDLFEDQLRTAEGFFAVLASLGGAGIHRTHEVPHVRAVLGAVAALPVRPE